jgi:DNA-binding CsgD family transcriptional regulator
MRRREIPWHWFRPGPEQDAARLREKARRAKSRDAARALADAARRALTIADRNDEIRRLWGEGWTGKALARRFGLAKSTVSEIVAGLPTRRRYGDPEDVAWPLPRRVVARTGRRTGLDVPASGEVLPPRSLAPKGSAHGRAVLDETKVARIKRLGLDGRSAYSLAREFGVSDNTVCNIFKGLTWRHVEPAPIANGGPA